MTSTTHPGRLAMIAMSGETPSQMDSLGICAPSYAKISKSFHYHILKNKMTFFNAFSRSRLKFSCTSEKKLIPNNHDMWPTLVIHVHARHLRVKFTISAIIFRVPCKYFLVQVKFVGPFPPKLFS